jgi:hypothetical protein
VNGIKKWIGAAALAAVAMIASAAAEASTLSFSLSGADYNYSWTMDSDPTPDTIVDGYQTNIKAYGGLGLPTDLPGGGTLYFFSTDFGGALGFQTSGGLSLFDLSGATIYDDNEPAPHFSPGIFAITFDNHASPVPGPYVGTLTVATIAATPIPAALPLFASALGGIGFVGWRRRKNAAAA